eukprot:scaffold69472_cov35-Tisochrysis_lutea.AAC.2
MSPSSHICVHSHPLFALAHHTALLHNTELTLRGVPAGPPTALCSSRPPFSPTVTALPPLLNSHRWPLELFFNTADNPHGENGEILIAWNAHELCPWRPDDLCLRRRPLGTARMDHGASQRFITETIPHDGHKAKAWNGMIGNSDASAHRCSI